MATQTLWEIANTLDKVREDLWSCDATLDCVGIVQRLSRLQAQARVQERLKETAAILRKQSSDESLPSQQATRVKYFLKFVFGKTSRKSDRRMRLRELDCSSLIFFGLPYTLKEVVELSAPLFDFLVDNIPDFVNRQNLSEYLYRDDIDKAVNTKFDPEDDYLYKKFLKTHIDSRPSKRKRNDSIQPSSDCITRSPNTQAAGTAHIQQIGLANAPGVDCHALSDQTQGQGYRQGLTDDSGYDGTGDVDEQRHPRSHCVLSPHETQREPRYMYTNAPASNISKIPEPFRTAVQNSRQWKWERKEALKTTSCWVTLFPKDHTQDVSLTIWCGHNDGYDLNDIFEAQRATSS